MVTSSHGVDEGRRWGMLAVISLGVMAVLKDLESGARG